MGLRPPYSISILRDSHDLCPDHSALGGAADACRGEGASAARWRPTKTRLLPALIAIAREHLERETGPLPDDPALAALSRFDLAEDGVIPIARGPVQAIDTVTVYDELRHSRSIVSLEDHVLDGNGRPARLMLPPAPVGPAARSTASRSISPPVSARPATDVPDTLKRAMLIHVAQMFSFRGVVAHRGSAGADPAGYDRLIAPFRMRRL